MIPVTLFNGDLAKIDSDGFYYIVGRKKRFLKIYGNRVNLDEVEKLLNFNDVDTVSLLKDMVYQKYKMAPKKDK
ncbi:MAG: hypothetical protein MR639_00530 [Clostridium sp.]|uniref:hypothetical protein n=1 Tax=Clostridium sp. TaxID=1506 RepID=UPI002A8AE994|nr:hypothetical protein [Clostridium sp.]MDY5096999.1 hypothetical protein [Clostridium sp.]